MDALYTFELPAPVDGASHVAIEQEIRDGDRITVSGRYGTGADDAFEPAAMMVPYRYTIAHEDLVDLAEQSTAAGRPPTKPVWEIDSNDIAAWLGEDPAVRQARIEAR